MHDQEGVIKYQLSHQNLSLAETVSISEMNAWRTLFFKLELIGQIKNRYDGYGFGNISQRFNNVNDSSLQFIISGTQTGFHEVLLRKHYCRVHNADPATNQLISSGNVKPSSEALTHASVYLQNKSIAAVIHVHSPVIWNHTNNLNIAYTSKDIPYGTPEMAEEVSRLMQQYQMNSSGIFSMLGHEDGIVAFSSSMEKAASLILSLFARAIALEQNN